MDENLISTNCYKAFAHIYDRVMAGVDYVRWADFINLLVYRHNLDRSKVLNLACGTGSLDIELLQRGWNVISSDRSQDMMDIARAKGMLSDISLTLKQAEMESFELGEKFPLILCLYDSLNYLLEEEKVISCFNSVSEHLEPGGGFIFDITTEHNILQNFTNCVFAENFPDSSYIWENQYIFEKKICKSNLCIFIEEEEGLFKKFEEDHNQKIYSQKFLKSALKDAGLEVVGAYDGFTSNSPKSASERIHFVTQKRKGKKAK